jgi:predicted negative regulator of RcsB-dependent stress response
LSTQPHPYDRKHLKQVLHKNEFADELVELRDWAKTHLEAVLIGALVLAAAVFGVVFFVNSQKQKALDASRLLNEAQDLFQQAGDLSGAESVQAYGQAFAKYQALASGFDGTEQATVARLGMANSDLAAGKAQDAEREYGALNVHDPKSPVSALAGLGVARALEMEGKTADAQAAYAAAIRDYPSSAITSEAKADLERITKNPKPMPVLPPAAPASAPASAPSAAAPAAVAAPAHPAPQPAPALPAPVPGR